MIQSKALYNKVNPHKNHRNRENNHNNPRLTLLGNAGSDLGANHTTATDTNCRNPDNMTQGSVANRTHKGAHHQNEG